MAYELFLFDLDDTLLDFKASERLSFALALQSLGVATRLDELYARYQVENRELWRLFEQGLTTKERLKTERFRRTFEAGGIDLDPELAGARYLETLPETVVLIDHAEEICAWLSQRGEIGIVTNGIQAVQAPRIRKSALAPYVSFVSVSEECGFAKPDARFFEYTAAKASRFSKDKSLVIGDRIEIDVRGAHAFGLDACWFNPDRAARAEGIEPKHEISHLSQLRALVS